MPDCKSEKAYRDGRVVRGHDRHILVKLSFCQEKVAIMKNARQILTGDVFFNAEDRTKQNLTVKKNMAKQGTVNQLSQNSVRLLFYAGCWRTRGGKHYDFNAASTADVEEA